MRNKIGSPEYKEEVGERLKKARAKRIEGNWTEKHASVLALMLKGLPQPVISQRLGLTKGQVDHMVTRPSFQAHYEKAKQRLAEKVVNQIADFEAEEVSSVQKARDILKKRSIQAAKLVVKLAKSGTPADRIKFEAAKDILDRVGLKPTEVIETIQRQTTPEELASMKNTLAEVEQTTLRLSHVGTRFTIKADVPKSSDTEIGSDVTKQTDPPVSDLNVPITDESQQTI